MKRSWNAKWSKGVRADGAEVKEVVVKACTELMQGRYNTVATPREAPSSIRLLVCIMHELCR